MALILNIETATKNCSVSVAEDGELLCLCEERDDDYSHTSKLHTFIEWALEGAKTNLQSLDAVCISAGPGSYTGLRIGVAAAKGLCYTLEVPLLSLYSLDGMAYAAKDMGYKFLIPMLDARRMEVYTAIYDTKANRLSAPAPVIIECDSFEDIKDNKTLFIGEGAEKCKGILQNQNWFFDTSIQASAKNMTTLSYQKFLDKKQEDLSLFEPAYLKKFQSKTVDSLDL